MNINNGFLCRFTQFAGAVVEMCTEFPWSGPSVQYTSGMLLLLAYSQMFNTAALWKYLIFIFFVCWCVFSNSLGLLTV